MQKRLISLLFLVLLSACSQPTQQPTDSPPPLFSKPQTFPLDTVNGYTVNPFTGDSIKPIVYRNGDTLLTGKRMPIRGGTILTDSVTFERIPIAAPIISSVENPAIRIPEIDTVFIDTTKLKTFTQGVDSISYTHILNGDTIPTGQPLPLLKGKRISFTYPQPRKTLPLRYREGSTIDMQYLDIEQGLPNSTVRGLNIDSHGNLWFFTTEGICKYDGTYIWLFGPKNGFPLITYKFWVDDNDCLWYSTAEGLCKFDGKNLLTYGKEEGFYLKNFNAHFVDSKKNLWLGTYRQGTVKISFNKNLTKKGATEATIVYFSKKEGLPHNSCLPKAEDAAGNLWYSGYNSLAKSEGRKMTYFKKAGSLPSYIIDVGNDNQGNIWILSKWLSLYKDNKLIHFKNLILDEIWGFLSIFEDSQGHLWICAREGQLLRYDGQNFIDYATLGNLPEIAIPHQTIEDGQGNLWIATENAGLQKIPLKNFGHTALANKEKLDYSTFAEDKEGNKWSANLYRRLMKFTLNGQVNQKEHTLLEYSNKIGFVDMPINDLVFDSKDNLWILGTKGVYKMRLEPDKKHPIQEVWKLSGISGAVYSLLEDEEGNIWFGTVQEGLIKYDGKMLTAYTSKEGLPEFGLTPHLFDHKGNLWISSSTGLSQLTFDSNKNLSSVINYSEKEGLAFFIQKKDKQRSFKLILDSTNKFWIVSSWNSLQLFDGNNFTYYLSQQGLNSNHVTSIIKDALGNIWMSTDKGLAYLQAADSLNEIKIFIQFDKKSGLQNQKFEYSSFIDSQNRIYWPTISHLTSLDLNNFSLDLIVPKPRLTNLDINGNNINFIKPDETKIGKLRFDSLPAFSSYPFGLELPYDANHLTFYFSAIDWKAPQKIQYSYRLLGSTNQWSVPSSEAKVDYRNLPYGQYTFQLCATGQSVEWSKPISYPFTINPPWWHTWWARMGYGLLMMAMVLGYNRWRTRQLRQKQIELEQQIEDATEEIRAEKIKAQASERAKQQFLATMSHEIRTPMHAISGMTKILKRSQHPPALDIYLNAIHQSSDNLLVILNDILDMSKIEAGKLDIETISMSPYILMQNVTDILKFKAQEKGISLTSHIQEGFPTQIMGDPTRLAQILINLAGNAIKFTENGGVHLSLQQLIDRTEPTLQFSVEDTGIGIPTEKLDTIFGSFEQVEEATTRKYGGTGLGLSICKQLVELQDGHIWVESTLGKGSNFSFVLPLVIAEGVERAATKMTDAALRAIGSKLKGIKILMAEDNEFNRMIAEDDLLYYLPQAQIDSVENGKLAISKWQNNNYDVILMDIHMPVMGGLEATKRIRQLEQNSTNTDQAIPIIAMTASLLKAEIQSCYEVGMNNFIPKPYQPEELVLRIEEVIKTGDRS